jgi:N-methylhydantoinase B
MGPREDPMTIVYFNDQHHFPGRGVLGGTSASPSEVVKYNIETGETTELPQISEQVFQRNERIVIKSATGGGYGDPLERDPELVKEDVREEYVSVQRARDIYGVVLGVQAENYSVDSEKTSKLRSKLKITRTASK